MHKRDKIRISGQQFFTFRINKDIMVSFTIIRNEKKKQNNFWFNKITNKILFNIRIWQLEWNIKAYFNSDESRNKWHFYF